jgi:alcohol dehydrogenase, propanol-preferring
MATMKTYRLSAWGQPGEYVSIPKPSPGTGEILIRMKAVGLCHSDLDMMDALPDSDPYSNSISAGYTLGHENAGVVEELGIGVADLKVGEAVVVHHMRHCGVCDFCMDGIEQHCEAFKRGDIGMTRGCGFDGGLAEFLVAPRTEVISIGKRDPVVYAALTDAGVTAYHAVKTFLHRVRPSSTVAVIGVGGLGAYGVQFLKLLSAARIFAIDRFERCLTTAKELGAHETVLSNEQAYDKIMEKTNGKGIDFIVDFVGNDQTLLLATKISRPQGRISVVGMQGGTVRVGWNNIGTSCEFALSLGSTRKDLQEVVDLAGSGKLRIDIEKFGFEQIPEAYEKLRNGALNGRAVICID